MMSYDEIEQEATAWADRLREAEEMLDYFEALRSAYIVRSRTIADKLEIMKDSWTDFTVPDNVVSFWAADRFQTDLIARKVDRMTIDDVYFAIMKDEFQPEDIPSRYFDEARRKIGRNAERGPKTNGPAAEPADPPYLKEV